MKNKNTVKVQIPTPKYDDLVMGEGGWGQINTDKALKTVKDQEIELYELKKWKEEALEVMNQWNKESVVENYIKSRDEYYSYDDWVDGLIELAKSLEFKYNKLREEIEDIKLEKYSEGYGDGYATGSSDEAFYHTGL